MVSHRLFKRGPVQLISRPKDSRPPALTVKFVRIGFSSLKGRVVWEIAPRYDDSTTAEKL